MVGRAREALLRQVGHQPLGVALVHTPARGHRVQLVEHAEQQGRRLVDGTHHGPALPGQALEQRHALRRGRGVQPIEAGEDVEQRGLAGARWTHDGSELAGTELPGHAMEDLLPSDSPPQDLDARHVAGDVCELQVDGDPAGEHCLGLLLGQHVGLLVVGQLEVIVVVVVVHGHGVVRVGQLLRGAVEVPVEGGAVKVAVGSGGAGGRRPVGVPV